MKSFRLILVLLLVALGTDAACASRSGVSDIRTRSRHPYYRGYSHYVDSLGDTILVLYLNEITCFNELKFKNSKEEKFYKRTVTYVKRALPYAKLIAETLIETYEYIETFETTKEREAYLKEMEGAIFEQYKPILKKFSKNQAKVLIKLVQRETNQTSYEIVKAFLGGFRATFWQGFGKLCGVNLKSEFCPEEDREDAIIERIATLVEQGRL